MLQLVGITGFEPGHDLIGFFDLDHMLSFGRGANVGAGYLFAVSLPSDHA